MADCLFNLSDFRAGSYHRYALRTKSRKTRTEEVEWIDLRQFLHTTSHHHAGS